jgi:hypothetical protein
LFVGIIYRELRIVLFSILDYIKGIIMTVPINIRQVERPKNTIVDDNGRDGPNRYAVRERASIKYVAGAIHSPETGEWLATSLICALFP